MPSWKFRRIVHGEITLRAHVHVGRGGGGDHRVPGLYFHARILGCLWSRVNGYQFITQVICHRAHAGNAGRCLGLTVEAKDEFKYGDLDIIRRPVRCRSAPQAVMRLRILAWVEKIGCHVGLPRGLPAARQRRVGRR